MVKSTPATRLEPGRRGNILALVLLPVNIWLGLSGQLCLLARIAAEQKGEDSEASAVVEVGGQPMDVGAGGSRQCAAFDKGVVPGFQIVGSMQVDIGA
ncbi:MAG: hypothetical protein OXC07_02310 [Kistimonas sp.]|nr:hypothetical protein [Kistimonas sp.]